MPAQIRQLYRAALRFAVALPVLFSIPALIEFAQHVVEIDLGLYRTGPDAVMVLDQRRLTLGFAKTLAMLLPGYWFVRYLAWGEDPTRAKRIERPAATLFGIQFALQALTQWYALFGPSPVDLLGLAPPAADYVTLTAAMIASIVGIYLTAWLVAWPLGNAGIGPLRSIALMAGSFWRSVGYLAAGAAPLMAVHYALGYGAIGRPGWLVWAMMSADAAVVGLLALTTAGASYLAARHAAERSGVDLSGRATSSRMRR